MALTPSVWESSFRKLGSKAPSEVIHPIKSTISLNLHVELQDFVSGRKKITVTVLIAKDNLPFPLFLFINFTLFTELHRMAWDLSAPTRDHTHVPPALEAQSLNHWTARRVALFISFAPMKRSGQTISL